MFVSYLFCSTSLSDSLYVLAVTPLHTDATTTNTDWHSPQLDATFPAANGRCACRVRMDQFDVVRLFCFMKIAHHFYGPTDFSVLCSTQMCCPFTIAMCLSSSIFFVFMNKLIMQDGFFMVPERQGCVLHNFLLT